MDLWTVVAEGISSDHSKMVRDSPENRCEHISNKLRQCAEEEDNCKEQRDSADD